MTRDGLNVSDRRSPTIVRGIRFPASLLFLSLLIYFMLSRFIDNAVFQPSPGIDLRISDLGIEGEEVYLDSDGIRIHGFYLPTTRPRENARAILFLHGNAGNASHRLPNAAELTRLGIDVLLIDYRGYGMSEGTPSESGAYADARAGLSHLIEVRGIPEQRIVLFGRSLGATVAVNLARNRELAGVILESAFTSAADVVRGMMGAPMAYLVRGRFDSANKIGQIRAPLLFFHGDHDEIIDYALGRRLFELAPEPKQFETIPGAGHNDTIDVGGRPYFSRIGQFIDEVAP
ncbi:MAG: alpha/beta hydrolase [Deltaproteobacteria bacterium]|nr:alpha/beta hydrolase [Deltaproteobacteria bacterium]